MGADLVLYGEGNLQVVHVLVHYEELLTLIVGVSTCPYDNLDDLVDHIAVHCESQEHTY